MRSLFVTPYLPSPPRSGGERRLDGLMRELARKHDVSVLSFVDPTEEPGVRTRATLRYCREVRTVAHPRRVAHGLPKRLMQLGSLGSPFSFERISYHSATLQRALDELLSRQTFDLVQFEFAHMALACSPRWPGTPLLLDEHNVEYDILRRTASAGGGLARRLYNAANWRKLRAEERRAVGQRF